MSDDDERAAMRALQDWDAAARNAASEDNWHPGKRGGRDTVQRRVLLGPREPIVDDAEAPDGPG